MGIPTNALLYLLPDLDGCGFAVLQPRRNDGLRVCPKVEACGLGKASCISTTFRGHSKDPAQERASSQLALITES